MIEIYLGVAMFTAIVLSLVTIILLAKSWLVHSGPVCIEINETPENALTVSAGDKLLNTLANQKIFLPSACGGGGTCGQCNVKIFEGGGDRGTPFLPGGGEVRYENRDSGGGVLGEGVDMHCGVQQQCCHLH